MTANSHPSDPLFSHLAADERVRFWRARSFGDLDCLHAAFRRHRYAPHSHDTYVAGAIVAGCETYWLGGVRHSAGPGDLCFVHPGEVHDGVPGEAGYVYRMSYPPVSLLRELAGELTGRMPASAPVFRAAVVHDPALAACFIAAHRGLEAPQAGLTEEEALVRAYGAMLLRHACLDRAPVPARRADPRIARVRELLETDFAEPATLADLCAVAGLGRTQLLRAFRLATGLTPHAYLLDRRVRAARDLLRRGEAPAAVAAAVGFGDQAHLTRAFKARLGITPGRYRQAAT